MAEQKTVVVPVGQYVIGFDGRSIVFLTLGGTYGPQPLDPQIEVIPGLYHVSFDGTNITFQPASAVPGTVNDR